MESFCHKRRFKPKDIKFAIEVDDEKLMMKVDDEKEKTSKQLRCLRLW
jgi:hypothetical protein